MGINDILGKLGGQNGGAGGLDSIHQLFGGGGIQGIVQKLSSNGLGQQVQSWIGNGNNQPVSQADLQQAVDPAQLQQVSQQTGMSQQDVLSHVAQALPHLVDQATPNGQVPVPDQAGGLSALRSKLKL